ncbi:MAG: hypothetical protein ABI702_11485 [Burkholderiales bacterium]
MSVQVPTGARLAFAWARLYQLVGWPGLAGLALSIAAVVLWATAWTSHSAFIREHGANSPVVGASVATSPASKASLSSPVFTEFSPPSDMALLLTQMKQSALDHGLEWRAAEYRVTAASPTQPASLEVRCTFKGSYPKLRGMLSQLKGTIPAFSIREFSLTRPNADTVDVEAKVALAVFLQDGALPSDAPGKGTQ